VAVLPFYLGFLVDLRALRLIRVVRVLRLFKLHRYTDALYAISNAFFRVRYEFAVMGFAVLTLGLICSVMVYEFEREAQPEAFAKLSDAMWYTLSTLTTVGYGDKVPATAGGRLVAIVLMIGGLGLFGTFVSLIGSAFIEEIRNTAAQRQNGNGPAPSLINAVPGYGSDFDPQAVLQEIEAGTFDKLHGDGSTEAVRLLGIACRRLLRHQSSH